MFGPDAVRQSDTLVRVPPDTDGTLVIFRELRAGAPVAMSLGMHSPNFFSVAVLIATSVAGCVDMPAPDLEPQARLIAAWDPLDCGEPHRVVFELEDERGVPLSRSAPCEVGGVSLDVPHWGIYRGRIYAWKLQPSAESEIRSEVAVRLEVDSPIMHWYVETPR